MKKTLIAVACAAFISTGAIAKPMQPAPKAPNNHQTVQMVNKNHSKPAPHHVNNRPAPTVGHHHKPATHVARRRPTPPPPPHHHHHSGLDFGDALIAFAILATAL